MLIYRRRTATGTEFPRPDGMPEALHRLLCARGISTADEARDFLRPDATKLLNPMTLGDMAKAVEIIRTAKKICVYGDYDVDGVCASAIMYKTFAKMGVSCEVYLPSRHEEGYGLNENAIRKIAENCDTLLTVDCGITSVELVELAKSLGMNVVVSDHHLPAEKLPECAVVDPFACDYPCKTLCGADVALKISEALIGKDTEMGLIQLAALATVADIVPLTGESRIIAKIGIDEMNRNPLLGIAALCEAASIGGKPINSGTLGFQLGPRLNASGRIGSARRAFELLTTNDPRRARDLADELNAENANRKRLEEETVQQAEEMLADFDFIRHRAIVLSHEGWNSGVIGLAASKIVEKYNYPTILIALDGEDGVGSCRSISGIDIHDALANSCGHLTRFGGHSQAAGISVKREEIPNFIDDLDVYLSRMDGNLYIPVKEYDDEIRFSELTTRFVNLMDNFAPTGMGNPAPVFRAQAEVMEKRRVGRDGAHLSLKLYDGTNYLRGVMFSQGALMDGLPERVDALFTAKINAFNGNESVELELRAVTDAENIRYDVPLAQFLTEVLYNDIGGCSKITKAELYRMVEKSPQGTLVIAADALSAPDLGSHADYFSGEYPSDRRLFNAVCVRPCGKIPAGYKNIVWAGMPAMNGGIELDVNRAKWLGEIPDMDMLRRIFVAMRDVLSKNIKYANVDELARKIKAEYGISYDASVIAIIIFEEIGLVGDCALTNLKRADPMQSKAYLILSALEKGGARHE